MATASDPGDERPFVVPCAALGWSAPLRWLRLGWRDLRRAPGLTLLYGTAVVMVSAVVVALAWALGRFALLATLVSGFVFVAPLLAIGLFAVSRALEDGRQPRLADSLSLTRRVLGQAAVFALGQMVLLLLWTRAGMMVNAFVELDPGNLRSLAEYLLIGSLAGSVFAALTFAIAAVSLPMVADRDVDMVTAAVSSVHAVLRNKRAMLVWALLIALLTALGFASGLLGFAVLMPWLAYASWHAYRETLDPSSWPRLPC